MDHVPIEKYVNHDRPFTELFSLLKRYEQLSDGICTLAYSSNDIIKMQKHIDNAVDVLMQGLQDLGKILGVILNEIGGQCDAINQICFFISGIANLAEALNALRLDTEYVLNHNQMNSN